MNTGRIEENKRSKDGQREKHPGEGEEGGQVVMQSSEERGGDTDGMEM